MRFSALVLVAGSLALSLVACGGKVIFVDDGAGGSGSSTHTSTSTLNQSSSVSTGPMPQSTCEKFCAAAGQCTNGPGCVSDCLSLYTFGCEDEAEAFLSCLTKVIDPNTCSFDGCEAESNAYANCGGPPPPDQCEENDCQGDGDSCSCDGFCAGQNVLAQCQLLPSPTCDCFINGGFVGSCSQDVGNACDLDHGCCSQFWGFSSGQ